LRRRGNRSRHQRSGEEARERALEDCSESQNIKVVKEDKGIKGSGDTKGESSGGGKLPSKRTAAFEVCEEGSKREAEEVGKGKPASWYGHHIVAGGAKKTGSQTLLELHFKRGRKGTGNLRTYIRGADVSALLVVYL